MDTTIAILQIALGFAFGSAVYYMYKLERRLKEAKVLLKLAADRLEEGAVLLPYDKRSTELSCTMRTLRHGIKKFLILGG